MFQRLQLSDAANEDLIAIYIESTRLFGAEQAERYWLILFQAPKDIDLEPLRPGSRARSGTGVKRS